jgi:hypothetical protein
MRSALRLLAATSAALLVLSGCQAAPDAPPPVGSTVEAPATDASIVEGGPDLEDAGNAAAWCDLASPSLIDETLGLKMQEPIASFSVAEIHCDYRPVEDGGQTLVVQFLLGQDHDTFAAYRTAVENPSEPSEVLAGVGDEAFYRRSVFDALITYVVAARKGSVILLVDAPSSLDGVTDLMVQVLAQLA